MAEIDDDVFKTNMSEHAKRRYEVMDEDQINEAEKFLDFYRSSHKDKDNRGLFDKWELIDLYWEGEAHPPESDSDPASNTNIINPNVEGQVAYLVEQNIAVTAQGRGPSDVPFQDKARITMEFVKEQNKMKRKLDVHERRRKKFGVGIFEVLFDPDMLDGMGLPVIKACNPAYCFPDPNITDIYDVQEGRFFIRAMNKSLSFARDHFDEELVDAIEPGFHPMDDYIFGEDEGENDEISQDNYLHMLVFTRYKKDGERRVRLVQMSGCGVILKDSKKGDGEEDDIIFPQAMYPYFLTPDMFREGTVWAKSSAELLINTQDLIDDLDDQIRINARLTGNPQRLVSTNSGIDPEKLTNAESLAIPTDEMDGLKFMQPPEMSQYIINRRNQALGIERQLVTRFSDQQSGIKQEGVDTATESLALSQGGSAGINHSKLLLEETLSEVFEYCLELCMEYWTEEEFFALTEKPGEFEFFRPSDLKAIPKLMPSSDSFKQTFMTDFPGSPTQPQYMPIPETEEQEIDGVMQQTVKRDQYGKPMNITKKIALNISVTVGAGLPSNKAFVYNIIKEARRDKAISLQEYRKLLRDYASLPVDENIPPELMQELGIMPPGMAPGMPGVMPNAEIGGLNAGGNPALSMVPGGVG